MGLTIVSRKNKNNASAKFWRTNKEHYGIFESGLLHNIVKVAVEIMRSRRLISTANTKLF